MVQKETLLMTYLEIICNNFYWYNLTIFFILLITFFFNKKGESSTHISLLIQKVRIKVVDKIQVKVRITRDRGRGQKLQ